MNPKDLQFFRSQSSQYPILACTEEEGWYFTRDGGTYSYYPDTQYGKAFIRRQYSEEWFQKNLKRLTLSQALTKLNPNGQKIFVDKLGIKLNEMVVKPEDKIKVISVLKSARAFNEDSAIKMDYNFEVLCVLSNEGNIGEYRDKYFLIKEDITKTLLTQGNLNV